MHRVAFASLATLLCAVHGAAAGASSPPPAPLPSPQAPPTTSVAGVTVTAPALRRVPDLVQSFGRAFSGDRLSRWRRAVCPHVTGFAPEQNSFIAARIVQISQAAKQPAPLKSCDPNIIVVATPTDLVFRQKIGAHAQMVLSPQSRWPVDKVQLSAFVKDDGLPAHVYYDSDVAQAYSGGAPLDEGNVAGSPADSSGALAAFNAPVVAGSRASRLTPNVDDAFRRVVVVLDGGQLEGLTAGQIAAYVAMITLAEVRIEGPAGEVDTIVNLFADRKAGRRSPDDLTFWDRAYLGALYDAPTQVSLSRQRSVMENRIEHAIEVLKLPDPPAAGEPSR